MASGKKAPIALAIAWPEFGTLLVLAFVSQCLCFQEEMAAVVPVPLLPPEKFVPGVYSERLPSPIFYDTYIPILFQYELPEWNKSEVTFNNWYHCESDTLPYKSCAVMFHLNKAISNLHIDFESLQPVQDKASHSEHYETLYKESSFCDKIQPHFSGIFIQKQELEAYIEMVKRCHAGAGEEQLYHVEKIADFNYAIPSPYNQIEMNFYETFYKPINASSEILATAVLANSRSNIQATLLGTYYAEKYRWVHALQDCQKQLLPHSLISLKKLNDTLLEFAKKAKFIANYEFAIGLDLMSKYYTLPLADCTYTNDSFVVRFLFPIKFKSASTKSIQLLHSKPVPFRYNGQLCSVKPTGQILHDTEKKVAYSNNLGCQSNSLCQTPTFHAANPCATALLGGNLAKVQAHCQFECAPYIQQHLQDEILVTRVAPDKYILTGGGTDANGTIITNCGGKPLVLQLTNDETESGANELTLPCACQFTVVSTGRTYYSDHPCGNASANAADLVHIEPWHFVRNVGGEYMEIDPELVAQYTQTQKPSEPEPQLVEPEPEPLPHSVSPSNGDHAPETSFQSATLLWVTFLSISLLLISIQVYVLYKLHWLTKSSCYHTQIDGASTGCTNTLEPKPKSTMDNLLYYKVTADRNGDADTEPEVCLIRNS